MPPAPRINGMFVTRCCFVLLHECGADSRASRARHNPVARQFRDVLACEAAQCCAMGKTIVDFCRPDRFASKPVLGHGCGSVASVLAVVRTRRRLASHAPSSVAQVAAASSPLVSPGKNSTRLRKNFAAQKRSAVVDICQLN